MSDPKKAGQLPRKPPVIFNDPSIVNSPRRDPTGQAGVPPTVGQSETREELSNGQTRSGPPLIGDAPVLLVLDTGHKADPVSAWVSAPVAEKGAPSSEERRSDSHSHDEEASEPSTEESDASRDDAFVKVATAVPNRQQADARSRTSDSSGERSSSPAPATPAGEGGWKSSVPVSMGQRGPLNNTRDRQQEKTKDKLPGRARGASQSGGPESGRSETSWVRKDSSTPSSTSSTSGTSGTSSKSSTPSSTTPAKAEKKGWRNSMPVLSTSAGLRAQLDPGDGNFKATFEVLMLPDCLVKTCAKFVGKISPLIPSEDGLNTHRERLEHLARKQVRKLDDKALSVAAASLFSVYPSRCTAQYRVHKLALDVALLVCGQAMAELAARPTSSEVLSDVHDHLVDSVTQDPGYKERFSGHHAIMEYAWSTAREKEQEKEQQRQLERKQEQKLAKERSRETAAQPGENAKVSQKAEKKRQKKVQKKVQKERQNDLPKKPPKDREKD